LNFDFADGFFLFVLERKQQLLRPRSFAKPLKILICLEIFHPARRVLIGWWLRVVVKFGWGTVKATEFRGDLNPVAFTATRRNTTHAPAGFARDLNRAVRRCESIAAGLVGARACGFEIYAGTRHDSSSRRDTARRMV
jgi:hypothetical protein